uniref:NAD(P)H-quinone oxidoreductase subunit 2, chloroplastic n=1 Tax=Nephroselmis pyriformis TaxID=156128 RepID=A0A8A2H7V2_9CHLO|nr:subunit 2 of NADH-plastoquinoneoxidoreductase [Nephroselmis pyriformis]QSV37278.1 subunit 2 of NADH-plastoquinoneoxidoreductase [Nephroselmis pyriformis]
MDFQSIVASLHLANLWPEGFILLTLLVLVSLDLTLNNFSRRWIEAITYGGLTGALVSLVAIDSTSIPPMTFSGSFQADMLSVVFRGFLILSCGLCVLLSLEYVEQAGHALVEFMVLLLTATLGGMLLAGANDLVLMFVALETLGLSSYMLTGYMKRDARSNEAALKYLLIGGASSSFFLYGVSWLYGASGGHVELDYVANALMATDLSNSLACGIALLLMTVGVGFKLSAAPFHQWTPDVYQGSPTPVVAFLSVGSKAAGLVLTVRMLATLFPGLTEEWHEIFAILAILSMVIGNVIALAQTSVKRMLGYSSVAQAGFLLIGLLTGHEEGYSSMILYMLIYILMNLGAFACVILFGLRTGTDQIQDYSGLLHKDPFLAVCFTVCLLSLGGIPPLAGFFGKVYLFWVGWQAGLYTLVMIGLITSVISIYYYLGVVKIMLVKPRQEMSLSVQQYPTRAWAIEALQPLEVSILVCVVGSLGIGVAGNSIFNAASWAVLQTPILL